MQWEHQYFQNPVEPTRGTKVCPKVNNGLSYLSYYTMIIVIIYYQRGVYKKTLTKMVISKVHLWDEFEQTYCHTSVSKT